MKKVFISYSWGIEATKKYVLELAKELSKYKEVEIILDKINLKPGHDMNSFMERSVIESDKVLIVCDEDYKRKADSRSSGAGIETQIISSQVYKSLTQTKFVPLIIDNSNNLPTYLQTRLGILINKYDLSEKKINEILEEILEVDYIGDDVKRNYLESDSLKIEDELYEHFIGEFEDLCNLNSWSSKISNLCYSFPSLKIDFVDQLKAFTKYEFIFNYIEKEKFKEFNTEIKNFSKELSELIELFLKHVTIDDEYYRANRFYKNNGDYNKNYDEDLKRYSEWEENLEKYVHNLTYKLNIISEIIRKDYRADFMLKNGKFSYVRGPEMDLSYKRYIPTAEIE